MQDYERPPDEAYDDYEQPRRQRRQRRKAFTITRSPWSLEPLRVYDDQDPDQVIEEYVAKGHDWWLEAHDPERAQQIRAAFYERVNREVLPRGRQRR